MRCDEALEFVSALYDGETLPLDAAKHAAHCAVCQKLLKNYAEMGAELRKYSRPLIAEPVLERRWLITEKEKTTWWEKGLQMMRIPRLAFAMLVVSIIGLGSRLAIIEVRAHSDGPVLMLRLTLDNGGEIDCALSSVDARQSECGGFAAVDNGQVAFDVRLIRKQGDRALLDIRTDFGQHPVALSWAEASNVPHAQQWVDSREAANLPIGGAGMLRLNAEWTDHVPVMLGGENQLLDPAAQELRVTSPLLLKNSKVAGDMQGASAVAEHPGKEIDLYVPGEGKFTMSLAQMDGAVPANVQLNRMSFVSGGQAYMIVTGTPVTRNERIWVKHEADYKPTDDALKLGYLGAPVGH